LDSVLKDLPWGRVGVVNQDPRLCVWGIHGRKRIDAPLDSLRKAFRETLHGL
jgi:hypothetical protein